MTTGCLIIFIHILGKRGKKITKKQSFRKLFFDAQEIQLINMLPRNHSESRKNAVEYIEYTISLISGCSSKLSDCSHCF